MVIFDSLEDQCANLEKFYCKFGNIRENLMFANFCNVAVSRIYDSR